MSITEKELAEALRAEFRGTDRTFEEVARHAAELLGVDLAPEPLEPGMYRHEDGQIVHLRDDTTRTITEAHVKSAWAKENRDKLIPARVVAASERLVSEAPGWEQDLLTGTMRKTPAVPVELSEAEVGELWDGVTANDPNTSLWDDYSHVSKRRWTDLANAALAKYGNGRAEVTREWLRNGIAELRGDGYGLNGEVIDIITDAVMDLLNGGDRG